MQKTVTKRRKQNKPLELPVKLDELDLRIARELETDARKSSREIAAKLGVAHTTVRRRINSFLDTGLLRMVALFNPKALGYDVWTKVGISVKHGCFQEVVEALLAHPNCYFIAESLGRFDIIISARFRSLEDLTKFVREDLAKLQGIQATETDLLIKPVKYYDFSCK